MVLLKEISMEVKRIKVVKNWLEPKSVRNIQVFLGFANFYRQFIQGFNRIAAPLTSILKITRSPDKLALSKNNGSRSTSSKNNDSKLAFRKNNSNNKVNGFGIGKNSIEYTKKSGKLFKSGKSKSKKTFKSRNLAKSRKKLSKSRNLTNFNATGTGPKFLIPDIRIALNCLLLALTKALIL